MTAITLTQELLDEFLRWKGHIVFANDSGVPIFRGDIESFRLQENRLSLNLIGMEFNQWGSKPRWTKDRLSTKKLEIDLAACSAVLKDHSGIYLEYSDTSTYKIVNMTIA